MVDEDEVEEWEDCDGRDELVELLVEGVEDVIDDESGRA